MFTNQQLLSALDAHRINSSNPDTDGLYPWDIAWEQASLEAITTAQIEHFRSVFAGQSFTPFWVNSRIFVKDPNDTFYADNGYPNPPLGAVFRTMQRDGTLGTGNFIEVMPAFFIVDAAIRRNDLTNAERALSFLDFMTVNASFYGSPIKVMAGIAKYENGSWVKKTDTIIMRNIFGAAWAFFRYANRTGSALHAEKGAGFLKTLALAVNNTVARVRRQELAPILEGALYAHMTDYGGNFPFVWNRFTIEGNWLFWMALSEAANWYGWDTELVDAEGTPFTLRYLAQKVGSFFDRMLTSGKGIMKHRNPKSLYLPYQFFIEQAWHHDDRSVAGMNFDWTGESGTTFGDTYWVGDLELWGLIGLAYLKQNGYLSFDVGRFVYQFGKLAVNNGPYWHDRYDFFGKSIPHDESISITFTALYGVLVNVLPNEVVYPPNLRITSIGKLPLVIFPATIYTVTVESEYPTRIKIMAYGESLQAPEVGQFTLNKGSNTISFTVMGRPKLVLEDIG
ncbi:hypothetical protein [Thermus phage P23-45]|uniref:Uncharacterized protein n=1 Tax=Thermus virus P23-45 TaxID=2914006 RepID=A7XXD6_BP234|nr:hypothetical protein P23p101 [Thermus phage P23-45]ABU96934.1 hypothetical protein P23p101 [Thermus phage P23-45]UYB98490.1 hypothetical protein [Thermus phage P23-45]